MKKTIKLFCLLLAVLTVCSSFVACGDDKKNTEETTAGTSNEQETDMSEGAVMLKEIGELNWNGDFTILHFGANDTSKKEVWSDQLSEGSSAGDILADAVFERNLKFQKQCNLTLGQVSSGDTKQAGKEKVQNAVLSNTGDYQFITLDMATTAGLALEGLLYNYLDLDVDLSKSWWDQGTASFNIDEHIYFMNGSWNYSDDDMTWVMLFNKDKYFDMADYPDIYQTVIDGDWTLSLFESLIQNFSSDNGDNVWDENDTYGFCATPHYSSAFMFGSGLRYIEYDGVNEPTFALTGGKAEKAQKLLEQVQRIYHVNNATYRGSDFSKAFNVFLEGRALFYGEITSYVINCNRQMEDAKFGVLPVPKYDEKQENYLTFVNSWAPTLSLPTTIQKANMMGDILTVWSILSDQLVFPKYYDVVLTTKSVQDEQSIKMLDIAFEHRVYDLAMYFDLGVKDLFSQAAEGNRQDFSSSLNRNRTKVRTKLRELMSQLSD